MSHPSVDPQKKPNRTTPRSVRCADRTLPLQYPQIMGVLNVTPDSFSDGGRFYENSRLLPDKVHDTASQMLAAGASILDIGGESTRPGAQTVSVAQELDRVIPVINTLASLDIILSVDTRHAEVARAAIAAGVHMINDVSAGADDAMLSAVADASVAYVMMHMQGDPQTMQNAPRYDNVVDEVSAYLQSRWQCCVDSGIESDRLLIDPGFGFGKTLEHNLQLLAELERVRVDGCALLVGLSRKSMLGKITGRDVAERQFASVSAALVAAQRSANVLRVHDVGATADALRVWQAVHGQDEVMIKSRIARK